MLLRFDGQPEVDEEVCESFINDIFLFEFFLRISMVDAFFCACGFGKGFGVFHSAILTSRKF